MDINVFLSEDSFVQEGNLYFQKHLERKKSFEKAYIDLRKREHRVYSDEVLKFLPDITSRNPLYQEWLFRKASVKKLANYLAKRKANSVLEIGCGNGWLSHYLAENLNASIIGVDVNETELHQAVRVFDRDNLVFVYADVLTEFFSKNSVDVVLMASCIQYFKNIDELLHKVLPLLRPSGELHIIDSPIYKKNEIEAAKERTKEHFKLMGHPEMTSFYYHHSLDDFRKFKYTLLYNPRSPLNMVTRKFFNSPVFPWLRITKELVI